MQLTEPRFAVILITIAMSLRIVLNRSGLFNAFTFVVCV